MPLVTFNYVSPNPQGESGQITQVVYLNTRPPRGARFYIRQVSVTSSDPSNPCRSVNVFIPELMGVTEQNTFATYILDNNGQAVPTTATPGIVFNTTTTATIPIAMNVFPNINLGRHDLSLHSLSLRLTPVGPITNYSIVIEWDAT